MNLVVGQELKIGTNESIIITSITNNYIHFKFRGKKFIIHKS